MVCPFCFHKKTRVYNSRSTKKLNATWRRRQCEACKRVFTTREAADPGSILSVNYPEKRSLLPYSRIKLLLSIARACDHRPPTDEMLLYLCETVEQALYPLAAESDQRISSTQIATNTAEVLQHFDTVAYVKYLGYYNPPKNAAALRKRLKK